MSYSITLSGWQLAGILFLIFLVFLFCLFFDFKRKCIKCGSRFAQTIIVIEVGETKKRILATEMKYRACLRCKHRMLIRKKSKGYKRKKEGSLTIRF